MAVSSLVGKENVGPASGEDVISRLNHYRRTIARYRVCLEIDAGRAAIPSGRLKMTDTSLGAIDGLIERLEVEIEGASLAPHPRAGLALEAVQIMLLARWVFERAYREQGPQASGASELVGL